MPFTNRGAFSACEWPDRGRPEELTIIPSRELQNPMSTTSVSRSLPDSRADSEFQPDHCTRSISPGRQVLSNHGFERGGFNNGG